MKDAGGCIDASRRALSFVQRSGEGVEVLLAGEIGWYIRTTLWDMVYPVPRHTKPYTCDSSQFDVGNMQEQAGRQRIPLGQSVL